MVFLDSIHLILWNESEVNVARKWQIFIKEQINILLNVFTSSDLTSRDHFVLPFRLWCVDCTHKAEQHGESELFLLSCSMPTNALSPTAE